MRESGFWSTVRDGLSPFGKLYRHENPVGPGTPDVHFLLRRYPKVDPTFGWIELKVADAWPARPHTHFHIPTLTKEQVDWATDYHGAGGRTFLLLRVAREVLLFSPAVMTQIYERIHNRVTLTGSAILHSRSGFPAAQVLKCLTA